MLDSTLASIIAFLGLFALGIGFHSKTDFREYIACIGWVLIGFYFFLNADSYWKIDDMILVIMSIAALPAGVLLAVWEIRVKQSGDIESALIWFRGAVLWSGLPYLLIDKVPWLNVIAIWFVAWQTKLFLSWTGGGNITLGETWVEQGNGQTVLWADWTGNRWFVSESLGEHAFYTQLLDVNGDPIGINFVLACTALQSMIIFVGAVVALKAPWRRRIRALLVTLPVIHVLNVFRNAGLVWLHRSYQGWDWLEMNMFDFGHSYAAKIGSLFAMFLMALVLFELLPKLHSHVLRLIQPLTPRSWS